jgi:hypothetical protein
MHNPAQPKLSRAEQSRVNGSKSQGPTSPEGKQNSSRNSLKHGFAAAINNVTGVEDPIQWEIHVQGFRNSFKPRCYVEQSLVDQLASINWRSARLVALETALLDAQISIQEANVAASTTTHADDPYFHFVKAWQAISRPTQPQPVFNQDEYPQRDATQPPNGYDIGSIELLRRYITTLDRQYRNTLLNLRQFQKDFAEPNEPEPKPQTKPEPVQPPPSATPTPNEPERSAAPAQTPQPIGIHAVERPEPPQRSTAIHPSE